MGFMDKASSRLLEKFGDETVRVVDYGKDPEENPREIPKPPARVTAKKRKERGEKQAKKKVKFTEDYEDWNAENLAQSEDQHLDPNSVNRQDEEDVDYSEDDPIAGSAFEIDEAEENYFAEQQRRYDESMEDRFSDVPDLSEVRSNQIQDVLEVLDIKPTFAIETDIFLPEDVEDAAAFDLQAPYGFEQGQVSTFVERTKVTVARYVTLLKQRNVDVAKLASVVDRLQVDLNNMKFQNEIANGINVMPTADSEDIERKYLEAKLKIKRLEDQIQNIEHGDDLTNSERKAYEAIQDELSVLQVENDSIKEENYTLRTRLAYLEEDGSSDDEPRQSRVPSFMESEPGDSLPEDLTEELPEVGDDEISNPTPSTDPTPESAFYVEDDDEEFSQVDVLNDANQTENGSQYIRDPDADDDDELEALMREWTNNSE